MLPRQFFARLAFALLVAFAIGVWLGFAGRQLGLF